MPQQADIRSLEAIRDFRAQLVTYTTRAGAVLDEVHEGVVRTRLWLEGEQREHWEAEVRRRQKALDAAQQALLSAKLSALRDSTAAEQFAVHRAQAALGDAEEKRACVKKWRAVYDSRVESVERGLASLRNCLDSELPRAIAHLAQMLDLLDSYRVGSGPAATGSQPEVRE